MTVMLSHPPDSVILVADLAKSYGDVRAVDGLTFHVGRGEIFGFLGPNGAGKTTTLDILEGLRRADGGRVTILGMDVNVHTRAIKRRIGVQLQSTSLLPDLTVYEQIRLFARLYGYRPGREDVLSLLAQVGLAEKASVLPDQLSGGQQQRLSLALALVNRPEIVFLDEPTTGLSSITTSAYLPLDTIRSLPTVTAVHRNGARLDLQTREVATTLRTILDLAEQHQVNLNDLHIKQPNLEEVFLNLTGRTIRA